MTDQLQITAPGVYDMTPGEYHADPVPGGSLSQSGAKLLLPPNCPAKFKWERDNPSGHKREFDFGHAAHREVLGVGVDVVVVDARDWRTKAAQQARDTAYDEGKTPVLAREYEQVQAMAKALREHPIAGQMFQPGKGKPEQALFWRDGSIPGVRREPPGTWRRALLDWLPDRQGLEPWDRLIIPDYKSAVSAAPEKIQKAIVDHGYHQQAAWYLDAVEAVWHPTAAFVFAFQEKTPPYLVTVAEPDAQSLQAGRELNRRAIAVYQHCMRTDTWPGYADHEVELIQLPAWLESRYYAEEVLT